MTLTQIVKIASNKEKFQTIKDYIEFCKKYLEFVGTGLQAVIVSQNENHYRFYQYKKDGHFNITRPINSNLMYKFDDIARIDKDFLKLLKSIKDIRADDTPNRELIKRCIYTIQQSIGAALDALPAGASNTARKVNGDLFERFIQLLIKEVGVTCGTGTMQVPVYVNDEFQFNMSYQHDLLLYRNDQLKVIGSVKTSSKDRLDKIFLDKFLYCKLTNTMLPHIAIFLNDVQRKNSRCQDEYGINATFLPGHFKGFTVKLNPLDGVYYCDIRPNMETDDLLKQHIRTIDHFFFSDIWSLLKAP
jgi:hypothetical protein